MFCKNCGKEIRDEAVICIHCQAPTGNPMDYPDEVDAHTKATGGQIALAIIIPIVGVVLGLVYMNNGKKTAGKTILKAGIISWALGIVAAGVYYGIMLSNL